VETVAGRCLCGVSYLGGGEVKKSEEEPYGQVSELLVAHSLAHVGEKNNLLAPSIERSAVCAGA
jgi:hypothetical protein